MVKRLKKRKKNAWFSTTFFGLVVAFTMFLLGWFYLRTIFGWLDVIINYGLGLSGSALIIFAVSGLFVPKMRDLIKGVFR